MIDWESILGNFGDRELFRHDSGSVSYREFVAMVAGDDSFLPCPGHAIPLTLTWQPEAMAGLIRHWQRGQSVILGSAADFVPLGPFACSGPVIILPSGGTTGTPKHVVHSMERLFAGYTVEERPPRRILCLYAADHIAGLDAFFQALCRGSTLVIPAGRDAESVGRAIEGHGVEVLPATPTFLQFLLLGGLAENRDLSTVRIIPHGAEPMPEALRRRIERAFPHARLVNRFGLTELGALPVEADPEDPDAFFLRAPGYAWKLENGEVLIQSPSRCLGTLEEGLCEENAWYRTGDLGEFTGSGSLRILGHRESLINVGGEKILPERVEALLLEQEGVLDAGVRPEPHPLTGQAVVADLVLKEGIEERALLRQLRRAAVEKGLSLAHVPVRLNPVLSVGHTRIGKRQRGGKA